VWKDSWDAYHHQDGTIANHKQGIASIEVQVTTYDALIDAAELFENVLDSSERGAALRMQADKLRQAILSIFWTEDKGGYFVLGTDRNDSGQLRQLKIRTSNMGHTLNSRLLKGSDPDSIYKREQVIHHLFSPEMQNVSGIRTLASDEYRFRPGSYHNGSVWLWDTHHIAKGVRRLGYTDKARELDDKILNVVEATHLLPEYVRGDDDDVPTINERIVVVRDNNYHRLNQVEQPPQEVQAWTAAAILATQNRKSLNN
jgi:glycogen debranching enzyme